MCNKNNNNLKDVETKLIEYYCMNCDTYFYENEIISNGYIDECPHCRIEITDNDIVLGQ